MKISDIDWFFQELDRCIEVSIRVVITGGAAAILFGGTRVTQDIDFEVGIKIDGKKSAEAWSQLQKGLDRAAKSTGISPEYATDIDRWSSIVMPKKTSKLYKKIGKIEVRILDPGLWAIGKLSRYLNSDVDDLVTVLKILKTTPLLLARLWGRALRMSPPSPAQSEFKRHVDSFFDTHSAFIWGKSVKPADLKKAFLRAATTQAS